ncbi:hypothetical protein J0H58_31450 [bacterium]|nr:hypothetical protein [bacterium]
MSLSARLVLFAEDECWVQKTVLPFPPFPGLGIRLDVYQVLNVLSVVVGDPGSDVTCIVEVEGGADCGLDALGFSRGSYP